MGTIQRNIERGTQVISRFYDGLRCFVTGGNGLIGGALCEFLLKNNAKVTVFDKSEDGTLKDHEIFDKVTFMKGDVLQRHELRRAMQDSDIVFHLAAQSGVTASRKESYDAWQLNVLGTLNVLDAAKHSPHVKSVVSASSNHVYGHQDELGGTKEDSKLNQLDTYSASKTASDYMARSYAYENNMPVVILRNTNCYGPHDPHLDHLIPGSIISIMKDEDIVLKSDGMNRKAFLYVDDIAEAYALAGKWMFAGGEPGTVFNVSGPSMQVMDVAEAIRSAMDAKVLIKTLNENYDLADENLDWTAFYEATGWQPKVSLSEGVVRTARQFKVRYLGSR